jgi:cytochrome c6
MPLKHHAKTDRIGLLLTSLLLTTLTTLWLWFTPIAQAAATSPSDLGPKIFQTECAARVAGGGNIIRRGKNLKLKALERNHIDTLEAVQTLVTQGKGNMSAYGDRLTPEEITAVSEYVLAQAAQNWP